MARVADARCARPPAAGSATGGRAALRRPGTRSGASARHRRARNSRWRRRHIACSRARGWPPGRRRRCDGGPAAKGRAAPPGASSRARELQREGCVGPGARRTGRPDPSRAFTFVHEQARDQETRQDKEHVHTDEPRVGSRHPHVTEEDEQDRDPAQTLKVWPVPRIACARRRHRAARYRSQVTAGAVPDRCRPRPGFGGSRFSRGTQPSLHRWHLDT